ncbi:hypothetical protein, partial [Bradyrhizobium sp. Mp64]|uniref:hypothetical protein n=1 Tax=Bradyrhizobium sp. Mp64 TaxID=3042158 RepID=UPI00248B78B0
DAGPVLASRLPALQGRFYTAKARCGPQPTIAATSGIAAAECGSRGDETQSAGTKPFSGLHEGMVKQSDG